MKKFLTFIASLFVLLNIVSCSAPNAVLSPEVSGSNTRSITSNNGLGKSDGLGVYYTTSSSKFSIWSPDSSNVKLMLNGSEYNLSRDYGYTESDIYSVTVQGDQKLKEYYFKINGIQVRDPYAVMAKPSQNVNIVMDLSQTNPDGGWVASPLLNEREDAIIYEMHVRDFTLDSSSGVSPDKRGKFLGMVETGTTCNGLTTGIDHLKELGINTIQIMPFYDFSTGQYNWGYDPRNYNVPEEQYSQNPYDYEYRVKELKTMINEFHKNGIRVVMDVVYNHTMSKDIFKDISSRYYTENDLSACSNSIDTGEPMVRKMILDSLDYWVSEYHIDGFRFDLMGIFHYDAVNDWGVQLNQKHPNSNLLMYGEPWKGGGYDPSESQKVRLGKVPLLKDGHVGVFNDQFRSALKGSSDKADGNYIFNNGNGNNIRMGSRGAILYEKSSNALANDWDPMFAYDPEQTISYVSAHDNLTLWDKIAKVGATGGYAKRVDTFAMGMIFTSQGLPFMHGGSEFLRSKVYNGDWTYAHNSYNAPDRYNKIYWNLKSENNDIYNYYRSMISLRKNHPGFRMNTWDEINNHVKTTVVNDQVIITEIDADKNDDSWDDIIVIYNSANEYTHNLPSGNWEVVAEDGQAGNSRTVSGSITAAGTAVTILRKGDSTIPQGWTEAYFRGTANSWDTTLMSKNSAGLWETTQDFGSDNPRFKITHNDDWAEAYPATDYLITGGAGTYTITFDENSKAVVATKIESVNPGPTPVGDLVIHFREWESATTYSVHPWNGLSGDVAMDFEGSFNGGYWWKVTISNAPADFMLCFNNSNGNWDGVDRHYTDQGSDIYVVKGDSSIYTTRQ